jgi:hypothetical protein
LNPEPCCTERAYHGHPELGDPGQMYFNGRPFCYRHNLQWRWPKIVRVRAAASVTRVVLNRYPGVVIGAAVYLRGRGLSLLWGRPGKTIPL